ncbi:MAG: GTP 3',8-cyclase MoaA [Pseudomonadota bacterium]
MATQLTDKFRRPLHDLRISVTDRCNFRCVYCMPKSVFDGHRFLARSELLSFEEIERVARVFVDYGVKKLRITGGEPMIRHQLEKLIERLANIPGVEDISMTTNASMMTVKRARSLRDAGMQRLNVSLDALDDETFKAVNDVDFPVERVLEGVAAADSVGFESIKINMVVKKGMNGHSIVPMARYFHGSGQILRFIEFMDVGNSNQWNYDSVISSREIADMIDAEMPIEPVQANYRGEVAKRWRFKDGGGEIGIISSVTEPFCGDCSRARLSAVGNLYTCLFASHGHDLREVIRADVDESLLRERVKTIWSIRRDRYSETRTSESVISIVPKVEMSHIGG